ncbi:MAG TPA: acyl-CoA dehydrogenase family protein [Stellaceae bacterium]|nr:acyl-CoA dehydrogenase family protein [Stellaceae bacterium]
MSEMRSILVDQASRLMAGDAADPFDQALWTRLQEAGLTTASIAEAHGGSGADLGDVLAILREGGRHAIAVPLAETLMAASLLSSSGLPVPPGPLTVAPVVAGERLSLERAGDVWHLSGSARRVPLARLAAGLAALVEHDGKMLVASVPAPHIATRHENLAGEPRDDLRFDAVVAEIAPAPAETNDGALMVWGAFSHAVMMAGALDTVLELTLRYANDRVQFGRPIGKFQAIQQQVAVLAAHVACAGAAADAAVAAAEQGDGTFEIACAKARIGEAAGQAAAIAHQVHGAMGFTREHRLHRFTRRLWAWRDEYGDEAYWWGRIGRTAARLGGDGLWPFLTARERTKTVAP